MAFSVKSSYGVEIENNDKKFTFDPSRKSEAPTFITHAHGDHCRGWGTSSEVYCTQATFELAKTRNQEIKVVGLIQLDKPLLVNDVEVKAYNAGHILGSTQFELCCSEGNVVYTGDINYRDSLTTAKAETVPCDLLIIESTYGTPCYFPSREYMHERIAQWIKFTLKSGRIPAFQTDALGNAQELIALINQLTKVPIVVHPRVFSYTQVYQKFGYSLKCIEEESEDGKEILNTKECVHIGPKNVDPRSRLGYPMELAFVSGWGERFSGRRKAFSLSDHSDFYRLLEYVEAARPKMVLTCHGNYRSKATLANTISRMLHIPASPLGKKGQALPSEAIGGHNFESIRIRDCVEKILEAVHPGFLYPRNWIISTTCGSLKRFTKAEVESGLTQSVKTGKLRYLNENDSYELAG